jgi:hypothetical protein
MDWYGNVCVLWASLVDFCRGMDMGYGEIQIRLFGSAGVANYVFCVSYLRNLFNITYCNAHSWWSGVFQA